MNLQFIRKRPGPRRGVRRSQTMILAERMARDRRDIEQARAEHARWLASRVTAGVPDLVYLEAARVAAEAEADGARLRREIHALALEERLHPEVPAVRPPLRPPLRPPIRTPEPEPARIEYSPATAAWLARRNSR
jgi:hypothetical protein